MLIEGEMFEEKLSILFSKGHKSYVFESHIHFGKTGIG